MAADGGYSYAQWRLGCACELGELSLTIDLEVARTSYRKAADGGHAGVQRRLSEAYEDGGLGRAIDLQVALMWFQTAAEGGYSYAQCRLAEAYEGVDDKGDLGLVFNEEKTLKWYPEGGGGWQRVCAMPTC